MVCFDYLTTQESEKKRAGREGGTPGNLRRATGTISGDETPEYQ